MNVLVDVTSWGHNTAIKQHQTSASTSMKWLSAPWISQTHEWQSCGRGATAQSTFCCYLMLLFLFLYRQGFFSYQHWDGVGGRPAGSCCHLPFSPVASIPAGRAYLDSVPCPTEEQTTWAAHLPGSVMEDGDLPAGSTSYTWWVDSDLSRRPVPVTCMKSAAKGTPAQCPMLWKRNNRN